MVTPSAGEIVTHPEVSLGPVDERPDENLFLNKTSFFFSSIETSSKVFGVSMVT
jgi:hypothetical protein